MDLLGLGSAIQGVSGVIQGAMDYSIAKKNLAFQQQNVDYQKAMQQQAWAREDSASQRKMADLKAAGLNPLLAYGQQAQSSAPIRTEAPQMESVQSFNKIGAALNLMQQKANIERTYAETQAIELQKQERALQIEQITAGKQYWAKNAENEHWEKFYRSQLTGVNLETAGHKEDIAELEGEIARLNLDYIPYLAQVRRDAEGVQLSKAQEELAAKILAVKQAKHNYDIYEMLGQPSNQAWGQNLGNLVKSSASLVGDTWKDLMSKIKGE